MGSNVHMMKLLRSTSVTGCSLSPKLLMREQMLICQNLYRKDLVGHYGCVNAIDFSSDGQLLASGGDDRRVLIWNVAEAVHCERATSFAMKQEHHSNIFCTTFDYANEHVFSSGNDEQVVRHSIQCQEATNTFEFNEPIYAVAIPNDDPSLFATAGEDGTIRICDVRYPTAHFALAVSVGSFHGVAFNPSDSRLVASANANDGVALWDIRVPERELKRFNMNSPKRQAAMSVRFDYTGSRLCALLRRLGPVLYDLYQPSNTIEFYQDGYKNECTMKSICFAGDKDQYVVSGSDDFSVYAWKVPEQNCDQRVVSDAHLVLEGHRSIVNQVRFDHHTGLLASSGVEKIIKLWSPHRMFDSQGDVTGDEHFTRRQLYTHDEYMRFLSNLGHPVHDYDTHSTDEDPRMIAFFDTLVQRDDHDSDSDSDGSGTAMPLANILAILMDDESSESDSVASDDVRADGDNLTPSVAARGGSEESSRAFGASLEELRRLFRSDRPRVITYSSSSASESGLTADILNDSVSISEGHRRTCNPARPDNDDIADLTRFDSGHATTNTSVDSVSNRDQTFSPLHTCSHNRGGACSCLRHSQNGIAVVAHGMDLPNGEEPLPSAPSLNQSGPLLMCRTRIDSRDELVSAEASSPDSGDHVSLNTGENHVNQPTHDSRDVNEVSFHRTTREQKRRRYRRRNSDE